MSLAVIDEEAIDDEVAPDGAARRLINAEEEAVLEGKDRRFLNEGRGAEDIRTSNEKGADDDDPSSTPYKADQASIDWPQALLY
jgi:hypothetical protein